jgi:hypothetical protein
MAPAAARGRSAATDRTVGRAIGGRRLHHGGGGSWAQEDRAMARRDAMGSLISGVGVLGVFASIVIFVFAKTDIQEIESLLAFYFGFMLIALGKILDAIRELIETARPAEQSSPAPAGQRDSSTSQALGLP